MDYETKDSGKRIDYPTGMRRDVSDDKPDFLLCVPKGIPYEEQMLTRIAALLCRGAKKYDRRNWEKAETLEELERFQSSALRHMYQWLTEEEGEDHASAVVFNIFGAESIKYKLRKNDI